MLGRVGDNKPVAFSLMDHVGLNVRELQRSAAWYERVFGFEVVHRWTTTWMVGRGSVRLGLFQRPHATVVDDLDNRVAITHFALLTDAEGFKMAQEHLQALGIPFDPPEDSGIAYSIFIADPDGHQVEITTYHGQTH